MSTTTKLPAADQTTTHTAPSPCLAPNISGAIVDVRAANEKIFHVHIDVLTQSPFFAAATKNEWSQQRNGQPIEVSKHKPAIVEAYLQWLYTHNTPRPAYINQYLPMYVLGQEMMDFEFQDVVTAAFIEQCDHEGHPPLGDEISLVYDNTSPDSPIRQLLVDHFCYNATWPLSGSEEFVSRWPAEFVVDVLEGFLKLRDQNKKFSRANAPWRKDPSAYFVGSRKKNRDVGGS